VAYNVAERTEAKRGDMPMSKQRALINFKPRCMGIAFMGMPHVDVARACQVVLDNLPEAPVLPSLQNLYPQVYSTNGGYRDAKGMACLKMNEANGKMFFDTSSSSVTEELTKFYQSCLADDLTPFGLHLETAYGQLAMLKQLELQRPSWKLVQFSIYGPITFGLQVTDEKGKPIFYNEAFRDIVIKSLIMLTRWYEKRLEEVVPNIPTLVLWGEPSLQQYGSFLVPISKELIIACLNELKSGTNSLNCVHCCANTDWSIVMESKVDAISFDAYNFPDNLCLYASEVGGFLDRGGMLAWGIVPNTEEAIASETANSLVERLEAAIDCLVKKGVNKQTILEASFIQPSCNTIGISPEACERILTTIREVSEQMRSRYTELN